LFGATTVRFLGIGSWTIMEVQGWYSQLYWWRSKFAAEERSNECVEENDVVKSTYNVGKRWDGEAQAT
jgi:hypothetical protein